MNQCNFIGRIGGDIEVKTTGNGTSVTSFNIAVKRKFKNSSGGYDVDWVAIVAWRQQAEFIAKFFKKGDMIGISGSLQTRNYEDSQGNKRTAVEIVAESADFCSGKSSNATVTANTQDFEVVEAETEDLPF